MNWAVSTALGGGFIYKNRVLKQAAEKLEKSSVIWAIWRAHDLKPNLIMRSFCIPVCRSVPKDGQVLACFDPSGLIWNAQWPSLLLGPLFLLCAHSGQRYLWGSYKFCVCYVADNPANSGSISAGL